jgi:hypothetical protein
MAGEGERAELGAADLEALDRRGIEPAEIHRQLALLEDPPPPVELLAAATPGDGIERLKEKEQPGLEELWREAAAAGRLLKLVPASGAATRMFASLARALESGDDLRLDSVRARAADDDSTARDVAAFAAGLRDLPFRDALAQAMARGPANGDERGDRREADPLDAIETGDGDADLRPVLAALLGPGGLGYGGMAKGLIPFHRREHRAVTPVAEHLDEAALLVRDRAGTSRVHFTVPEGAEEAFRLEAAATAAPPGTRLELGFSTQSPATDTVALDAEGRPFRTPDGALLFRPGGHGALLRNLEQLGGELVLVKNIDNVQPAARRGPSILWQRLLVGFVVRLQRETFTLLDRLEDEADDRACADARAFLARWFAPRSASGDAPPGAGAPCNAQVRDELRARLDRPLRVAGMVEASGEPGGGPFWARAGDGRVSKQIVETAEIAPTPEQQALLRASTHFNPVLMALALRDRRGQPYRLGDFVDRSRVFVTERTASGASLRALEHPGLWNGSMSGWNTVFVEIPKEAFTPVKTVLDLLRPEHQT